MKKPAPSPHSGLPSTAVGGSTIVRLVSAERAVATMRAEDADFRDAYDGLNDVDWEVVPAPDVLSTRPRSTTANLAAGYSLFGFLAIRTVVAGALGVVAARYFKGLRDRDD